MNNKPIPIFEKRIFWDIRFEELDYDAKANFVIERVFDRGDVQDIRNCRRYYGDKKIADVLVHVKSLRYRRIFLASAVLDIPVEQFRCYTLRQSNPELYPY